MDQNREQKYYVAIIRENDGRYNFFVGSYLESADLFRNILGSRGEILAEKGELTEETANRISQYHGRRKPLIEKLRKRAGRFKRIDVRAELEGICS